MQLHVKHVTCKSAGYPQIYADTDHERRQEEKYYEFLPASKADHIVAIRSNESV